MVIDPSSAARVGEGLTEFERIIESEQLKSTSARRQVISRFSAERIAKDSIAVLDYARKRFEWCQHNNGAEPQAPAIERWP
jgi:hypothetical protein